MIAFALTLMMLGIIFELGALVAALLNLELAVLPMVIIGASCVFASVITTFVGLVVMLL